MKTYHYIFSIVFCAVLFTAPSVVYGFAKKTPMQQSDITLSFAPIVKKAAPAVVNIYTQRVVQSRGGYGGFSPFMNDPFFRHFFGQDFYGRPMRKRLESSLGSGVIVSEDGLMVSNAHVVKGAEEIRAVFADGQEYQAKVILEDTHTDLAVLQMDTQGDKVPFVALDDSDSTEVGDIVLAIGNPFGVGQTVTSGIVSAISRTAAGINDYNFFIQTDAAINPGNSGGALVGMNGKVIGVNTAIYSRDGGSLGIGFAIPANMVRVVLRAAQNGGEIKRIWLGISAQKMSTDIAQSLGLKRPKGALVTDMHDASPVKKAGVKTGDIVTHLNGKEVEDPASLRFRTALLNIGDVAVLTILRKGKEKQIRFHVGVAPEDTPRNTTELKGQHPLNGVVIENISPAVLEDLPESKINISKGVVVSKVIQATRMGLRVGDVIKQINKSEIKTVKDVLKAVEKPTRYWTISIMRGGQIITMRVTG